MYDVTAVLQEVSEQLGIAKAVDCTTVKTSCKHVYCKLLFKSNHSMTVEWLGDLRAEAAPPLSCILAISL